MEKQPKVFIIVLNYNGLENTQECVISLKSIAYSNYKIVIVDNGSSDDSVPFLKNKFPDLAILINKENLGYAGGNNVGIRYALKKKCDFLLLINNDVTVRKDFLDILIQTAISDKNIAITGPMMYYPESREINFAGGFIDKKNYLPIIREYKQIDKGELSEAEEVDFAPGTCFLMKVNLLKKIGVLDEGYHLLWEETDYCFRVKKAGYKIMFEPKSIIWPKESASFKHINFLAYDYYYLRNRLLFLKKNVAHSLLLRMKITIDSIIHLLKLINKCDQKNNIKKIKAISMALADYYRGRYGKRF